MARLFVDVDGTLVLDNGPNNKLISAIHIWANGRWDDVVVWSGGWYAKHWQEKLLPLARHSVNKVPEMLYPSDIIIDDIADDITTRASKYTPEQFIAEFGGVR